MKATIVLFLVLLNAVNGFAPVLKTTGSPVVSLASSLPDILQEQNEDIVVISETSRRDVLKRSSLSLLTIGSCLQPFTSNAEESSATDDQTFTVLFTIQLDSTKPDELSELEIECHPDWAPGAAARFKELVELGFYKDSPFFRVLPGFINLASVPTRRSISNGCIVIRMMLRQSSYANNHCLTSLERCQTKREH